MFETATELQLDDLFAEIEKIDPSLTKDETAAKKMEKHPKIIDFLKSHCLQRNYMFSVKRCDKADCDVCKKPRLPSEVFSKLSHLSDPIPDGEHYKPFSSVCGTTTNENRMPSLKEKLSKGHGLAFDPSAQTAKNMKILIKCIPCSKMRLVHAKKSLPAETRSEVERELQNLWYTCGCVFTDTDRESDDETNVNIFSLIRVRRNLNCRSPIEKPYYKVGYAPLCYHCGHAEDLVEKTGFYPMCQNCITTKQEFVVLAGKKKFEPKDKSKKGKK